MRTTITVLLVLGVCAPLAFGQTAISLEQAVKDGKAEVEISGIGGSTGDAILIAVRRKVPEVLRLTLTPGTVFKSVSGTVQNMVGASIKGERVGENSYRRASEIVLADNDKHSYVIEAYCLDFHKPNPGSSDSFTIASVDERATKILQAGKNKSASIAAIQSALWIQREGLSAAEVRQRFPATDADIGSAHAILQPLDTVTANTALGRKSNGTIVAKIIADPNLNKWRSEFDSLRKFADAGFPGLIDAADSKPPANTKPGPAIEYILQTYGPPDRIEAWAGNVSARPRQLYWYGGLAVIASKGDGQVWGFGVETGFKMPKANGAVEPVRLMRTWTDSTGTHKVEAEFVDFKDGKVQLKKEDGKTITIPIERLSDADQDSVKSQTQQKKPDVAQVTKPPLVDADVNDRQFALESIPAEEAERMPSSGARAFGVSVFNKKTGEMVVLEESIMDKLQASARRLDLSRESDRQRFVAEVVRLLGEERARWGITISDMKGRPAFRWPRVDEEHTAEPATPKARHPLEIKWKSVPTKAVKLEAVPDIHYVWTGHRGQHNVAYVIKAHGNKEGKPETFIISGHELFQVSDQEGAIRAKDWSLGLGLTFAMWGAHGEGTVEIAFFEPLRGDEKKALTDRTQVSNWIALSVDLGP